MRLPELPKKLLNFCFDSKYRYDLLDKFIYRRLPDELYLYKRFHHELGYRLNLKKPRTFNEKIQWLKLHDRNPKYTQMVDKYEAKKYVADIIGEEYIIPILGVWDRFEDIDFNKFPDRFVLKTTHDSGTVVICKDKKVFDVETTRRFINKSLKSNYYYNLREWPYKDVKPRIIAEKYMEDESNGLSDYKFYCFNGEPKLLLIATDRHSKEGVKMDFFDMNFNQIKLERGHPSSMKKIEPPKNFERMKEFSMRLSKNIPFLRCDFYETDGKLFFGELTFYPASGFGKFSPDSFDIKLGDLINLDRFLK